MKSHPVVRSFSLLCIVAGIFLFAAGCASTPRDRDSELPWNAPQPWEGSPAMLQGFNAGR